MRRGRVHPQERERGGAGGADSPLRQRDAIAVKPEPGAAPQPTPPRTPCLVFRASTHWYAIPAAQVVNVSGPVRPVRVPGTPPFIRGVIPLTGKVVPVLSLAPLLGESESGAQVNRLVLVQDGARLAACEVAEIHGIEPLDDAPAPGARGVGAAGSAPLSLGDRLVTRLEANRLMDLVAGAVRERA